MSIATLLTNGANPADLPIADITQESMRHQGIMRAAFASYAQTTSQASIRPCWSTWNVLCRFFVPLG